MRLKHYIQIFCRVLIGLVFLFSGFVKAVDPLGTNYKMVDYLEAFGLPELSALALPAAFIMIAFEFTIGFNLVFSLKVKLTAIATAIFMLCMTPLTLYIMLENPVSDCGCFGDFLVISNEATFWKNIAIDIVLVLLLLTMKYNKPRLTSAGQWLVMLLPIATCIGIEVYCYNHLPIFDFRPYKIGNNIQELMIIPPDAPQDKYETTLIYEKDGKQKEFTLLDYPEGDSTWTFVDSKSVLLEKGYVPPIHDFSIVFDGDNDLTDVVLDRDGYTLLLISSKLEDANTNSIARVNGINNWAQQKGIPMYCLTSSFHDDINEFKKNYDFECEVAQTDEITLKTIIRSNPGLVLLKKGTVVNKWHYNDFPTNEELDSITK